MIEERFNWGFKFKYQRHENLDCFKIHYLIKQQIQY